MNFENGDHSIRTVGEYHQIFCTIDVLNGHTFYLEKPSDGLVRKPNKTAAISGWDLDIPVSHYDRHLFCPCPSLLEPSSGVACDPCLLH
jgi:hypothetical protein